MNETNTTVFSLEVKSSDGAKTFRPTIRIADNGIWDISGHEELRIFLGHEGWQEWIEDFWADPDLGLHHRR